jgi:CRP/FNR family cyclic AMP-dependent transcriptional regulator
MSAALDRAEAWAMRYGLTERLNEIAGIMLAEEHETSLRKNSNLFDLLTQEQRDALLEIGERRTFEVDQPLFEQGDPHDGIYLIETGRVSSYYLAPSGRQITLAYWFPGNLVGALSVFGGGSRMWGSSAVERSETTFLPGPELRRAALRSAEIAVALIEVLSFKARCYSTMAQMVGTRSATERLEHLLVFLARTYGVKEHGGIAITVSLNQAELASLIGSSRQWVTMQLARLQRDGIIRYNRGMIVVRKLQALTRAI